MPPKETLEFGKTFAPHMLTISYSNNKWSNPEIKPLENASIPLASSCLNYGMTCFEGMKAYRTLDGESSSSSSSALRLFRPDLNMQRLSNSMERISLPGHDFSHDELIQCISKLITLDQEFVPYGEGYSLYLRPNVIAINENLGLAIPDSILLYVMTSPVGPYYASGFKPIRLLCETNYVRACRGGTGDSKVGGNYAGAMKPSRLAAEKGYSQVLWLWDGEITEVGAMNVFFVFENKEDGQKEIVTPPLSRGDILPGVTRRSIIELANGNGWEDYDMVERNLTMKEVASAVKAGTLVEAFGAGTGAVVTPIECINYNGEDLEITATGEVTQRAWDELMDIQYGKIEHPWSYKIDESTCI
jgi:branched-chain amino acid aminotransferase